jgi:hypothetical protein
MHVESIETRNSRRFLMGMPEIKRQLRVSRRRWADNFKLHFCDIGWSSLIWIHLVRYKGGSVAQSFENYNTISCSMKRWGSEKQNNCWLPKKDSSP